MDICMYVVYLDYLFLCAANLDAPAVWWKKDWCLYEMREKGNKGMGGPVKLCPFCHSSFLILKLFWLCFISH